MGGKEAQHPTVTSAGVCGKHHRAAEEACAGSFTVHLMRSQAPVRPYRVRRS
jgi:hypothetical protein